MGCTLHHDPLTQSPTTDQNGQLSAYHALPSEYTSLLTTPQISHALPISYIPDGRYLKGQRGCIHHKKHNHHRMHPIDPLSQQLSRKVRTMATQAERTRRTLQTKNDKYARVWAYVAMGAFLPASIAANVATAPESDLIGQIIAGVPPVSLFITSMMFERMRSNWAIKTGMLISVIVSLVFSWYHIAHLAMDHGQPWYISWLLPAIVDVPMLFAGTILLNQAKLPEPTQTAHASQSAPKTHSSTTPTKSTRTRTKSPAPTNTTQTNTNNTKYPLISNATN